jgi:uncharacterized protein involved in exopolysaccharide biosynthesis
MSPSRSVTVLQVVITLICVAVGTLLGTSLTALRITAKPQVFRSLAKVVTGGRLQDGAEARWLEQHQDFCGTIVETLESAEMNRKARERVHSLHPDLKVSDVEITARQSKGSLIFYILATGSEPKYTQIFLNALLDEYMAHQQIIREQGQGKVLSTFLQEVVNKQKTMEETYEAMEAAGREAKTILAKVELERLKERLKALSNERDDLRMALKGTPPDAAAKNDRLALLDEEIRRISSEIIDPEAAMAKLNAATERYQTAKAVYEQMFTRAENFQNMFNITSEYVAIMERATSAAEHVDDWKMPIIVGGGAGAAVGLVAGLLVSFFITMLGKSNTAEG